MNPRTNKWLFFVTTLVLTASFVSYGYKVLASESQERKEIEIVAPRGSDEPRVLQFLSSASSGSYLGVGLADVSAEDVSRYGLDREEGVLVKSVEKSSPAADAGIQEDDVILSYAGNAVIGVTQFQRLVSETPSGRKVPITVLRAKKKLELTAKVGKREGGRQAQLLRRVLPNLPNLPNWELRIPRDGRELRLPGDRDVRITIRKPRLGISAIPLTEQLGSKYGVKDGGVLVTEVNKDSVAEKAGLKAGDVITDVDAVKISDLEDIARALDRNEGRSFDIKVIRDQKTLTLKAQLPEPEQKERRSGTRVDL